MHATGLLHTIASGPSGHLPPAERRTRRGAIRSLRTQAEASERRQTLLLYEGALPHRLTPRSNGWWARAMARLLGPALDRRLAAGRSPESHLLLAARAQALVSPDRRLALAHEWTDLLARARTSPILRDPRAPINREAIAAHAPAIGALLDVLEAQTPVHVRGLAVMSWLLTDGTGPLYDPRRSRDLGRTLREASDLLTPSAIFSDTHAAGPRGVIATDGR